MTTPAQNPPNGLSPFEFQSHQPHSLRAIIDEHGEPWFIAKDVATILDKHVLDKIRELIDEISADWCKPNFRLIQIDTDLGLGRTRKDPAYELTRDAFALLAMGFTGKTALAFKLAYIQAFNRMEMELLETRLPQTQDSVPVLPPPAKESSVTRLLVTMREGQQPTTETLSPNKHVLSLNDFTELARKTGYLVISKDELNRRLFVGEG